LKKLAGTSPYRCLTRYRRINADQPGFDRFGGRGLLRNLILVPLLTWVIMPRLSWEENPLSVLTVTVGKPRPSTWSWMLP